VPREATRHAHLPSPEGAKPRHHEQSHQPAQDEQDHLIDHGLDRRIPQQKDQEPEQPQDPADNNQDGERPPQPHLTATLQALRMLTVPVMLEHACIVGA